MHKSFWFVLLLLIGGIVIVGLPDSGKRLFSFNKDHGPSMQDMIGLCLIIIGWIWIVIRIISNRNQLFIRLGLFKLRLMALLIVAGGALISAGILSELNNLLWSGIALSAFAYIILMIPAFRKNV
jgi:uncharacterized protein YjeT (DUF2065 family)